MSTKYIVFDPEASNESITVADFWQDWWEDAWDGGHIEIVDIRMVPPKRYGGNGLWIDLALSREDGGEK